MSSYVESSLLKDEKLVYFTRPHWVVFAPAFAALLLTIAIWHWGPIYLGFNSYILPNWTFVQLLSLAAFVFTAYWFLSAYITYHFSEYAITDRRVILKEGWVRRNAVEIFLRKLEGINADQTVLGRILGYGTITIIGTGGTKDTYFNLPKPFQFRKIVQQQTDLLIDDEPHED